MCIVPDPKLISLDFMPKVELIERDFKERKKKVQLAHADEVEDKMIQRKLVDFNSLITDMQVKRLKKKVEKSISIENCKYAKNEIIRFFNSD